MSKRQKWGRRSGWLAGLLVLASLVMVMGSGVQAAEDGALSDIIAGCESFSLTVTFRGTVAEENGFDYVRLRLVDAGGAEVFLSEPLGALVGETVTIELVAGYAQIPVAGPVLFELDDYNPQVRERLPSLASEIVVPDCATFPPLTLPTVTTTCAVRLRTGPGVNYRWRSFLPAETSLTVIGRLYDASWLQVRVDDSRIGWVFDGLCVPGSPEAGTYAHLAVTFFRTADEVLRYEFTLPPAAPAGGGPTAP